MQKIKNEKGVTLSGLVVTIIVLIIILGISLNLSLDSIDQTKDRQLQAELEIVQHAAVTEYTKANQLGYLESNEMPSNFVGTEVTVSNLPKGISWVITTDPTEKYKAYYELQPEDLSKIDVVNSEYVFIVNYYTGEVYNKTEETTSEGVPLYIKATNESHNELEEDTTSFNDWES